MPCTCSTRARVRPPSPAPTIVMGWWVVMVCSLRSVRYGGPLDAREQSPQGPGQAVLRCPGEQGVAECRDVRMGAVGEVVQGAAKGVPVLLGRPARSVLGGRRGRVLQQQVHAPGG